MLWQSALMLEVLVSGVWRCFGSCQNKAKTVLLLLLTWKGPLYPETGRGIPSSVNKERSATLIDLCSRDEAACSVPHPMSSFQSLCSRSCLMVQQLLCLLFHLFSGFLLLHMYIFPCWKSCLPPRSSLLSGAVCCHTMVKRLCSQLHFRVSSLASVRTSWILWLVPHTLGCVAASSVPAVRIICSLVQKGLCSYLIVDLSVPVSQWKQKIEGVLNQMCCLSAGESVNLTLTYTMNIWKNLASERHTWSSEGNRLKPVDMVWTSARSSRLCYSLVAKLAEI